MSTLRIALVGGGPAGLTLARLLQINNISCTVFELDSESLSRDQGGTIDLHPVGGQLALKHAGLIDEFKQHSRPEGEAMKLVKFDGRVLFDENKLGNNSIRVYAGVRQPEDWLETCGIDWSHADEARKKLVEQYYADCGEDLKRAVLNTNDKLVPRKICMLPIGYRWTSDSGVTLIGDAAHVMTPFAGVGVNLAMVDSLDLAKAIVSCEGDREKIPFAIKAFEDEMFIRTEQFARKSYKGLVNHFSAGGCEEMLERLKGR